MMGSPESKGDFNVGRKVHRAVEMAPGVTHGEAAEVMMIHPGTLAAYGSRRNANPSPEKVRRMAEFLNIRLAWFFDGEDTLPPFGTYEGESSGRRQESGRTYERPDRQVLKIFARDLREVLPEDKRYRFDAFVEALAPDLVDPDLDKAC